MVLLAVPVIFLPTKVLGGEIQVYAEKIIASNAAVKRVMGESLRGIRTVKIFWTGIQSGK